MKSNTVRLLGFISLLNVALGVCWGLAGGGGVGVMVAGVGWVCVCTFIISFTIKATIHEVQNYNGEFPAPPPPILVCQANGLFSLLSHACLLSSFIY